MKKFAKILGGLIALLVIAALAAPVFISSDALKAQLIAQVKKATGRTLEIKGATHVSFFPNIAVTAEDVTLGNPEGFTTPYLVSLKKLSTGAELMPLLHGELIINGITLDTPVINLEELKSGARNWEFTANKIQDSAEQSAKAPETKKSESMKRFALGDVTITDAAINLLKPNANVVALKHIDATIEGADANSPLKIEAAAEYREEDVSIALAIARTKDFLGGKVSPLTVSLKLPGASADFNGEGALGEQIRARGKLNATIAALPKVLSWATGKPASQKLPQQIMLNTELDYADQQAQLTGMTLRADDLTAEGKMSVNHVRAVPKITGSLKFNTIDVAALRGGANASPVKPAGKVSDGSEGWSDAPIDLSALKAVDADIHLGWDALKSGALSIGKTAAQIVVAGGKLTLNVSQAAVYQGQVKGTASASNAGIGFDLQATGIDIDALMSALSGTSRLTGKTNLELAGRASGTSQLAWVNSLNGRGSLTVADGALKGINIGQFLRNAKQGFLFKSGSESTDFSELKASFTITTGVLHNDDLAMKSPALRVSGAGSANLPNRTLNYRLVPTLAATSKGQGGKDAVGGLTVPLVITGSWSNPSVMPDLAGALKEGLNDPEALKENVKGLKDGIKNFNSPKDLKRALLGEKPATTNSPATSNNDDSIKQGVGSLLKGL